MTCCLVATLSASGLAQQVPSPPPERAAFDFEAVRREKIYTAVRTMQPIVVDGDLDEAAWAAAPLAGDFFQIDPRAGIPAEGRTEFRVLYDDEQIYVAVVCHQSDPTVTASLYRDFAPAPDNDNVTIMFDTFDNDRDAFFFGTNPGGAQRDQQASGGVRSESWDGVFSVASLVQSPGWTVEFAVPFKTLRFDETRTPQRWGFNVMRIVRATNEWSMWAPAPRPFNIFAVFTGGTLEGIERVSQGRNLRIKPFAVANYRPDLVNGLLPRRESDVGLDVKYGLTSELTLDVTLNTDFSQVEADEQQVNLTRFSLFFPEKREFFLENAGLFDIGAGAGTRGGFAARDRDIIPFFSRRIGLSDDGQPLPLQAGARLNGRVGGLDVGLLNIRLGEHGVRPADTWTVGRIKRNLMANSDVGAFVFNRDAASPGDWNRSAGLDANLRLLRSRLSFSGFAMKAFAPDVDRLNGAGTISAGYEHPFYMVQASYLSIEEDFRNDFGFVPRGAIRKTTSAAEIRARPRTGLIREYTPRVETEYVTDQSNRLLTRAHQASFRVSSHAGDNVAISRRLNFERLDDPFRVRRGREVPVGDYRFDNWNVSFQTSRGRWIFGNGALTTGGFWNGTLRETRLGLTVRPSAHLASSVSWTRNDLKLPSGGVGFDLVQVRVDVSFSSRMFLNTLTQYNTDARTVASNVRFRFIHHPLSDVFIVYNDSRGILGSEELNRTLSLKLTHLFSM